MPELFYSLAILACPVGMSAMMWFMARGQRRRPAASAAQGELARMRAEIDQLRTTQQNAEALADKQ